MDVLVMLEETPDPTLVLAQVSSVRSPLRNEQQSRDVVTLFGVPSPESLALALAAALESRRAAVSEENTRIRASIGRMVRTVGSWGRRVARSVHGAVGHA